LATTANQNIRGADGGVELALPVHETQSIQELPSDVPQLFAARARANPAAKGFEGNTAGRLHHKVRGAVCREHVQHSGKTWMLDEHQPLPFLEETLQPALIFVLKAVRLGRDKLAVRTPQGQMRGKILLEGDLTLQMMIPTPVGDGVFVGFHNPLDLMHADTCAYG
jgi:hypothetical protein